MQAFPKFNLDDKVSFEGEVNVTNVAAKRLIQENNGTKEKGHTSI